MGGKRWKKSDAGLEPPAAPPVVIGPGWLQAKDAEQTLHRLCGSWRDQKGSHYALSMDGGSSLGVITTRPGGKVIRTGGLIRVEWRNSVGRIVWGRAGARFLYKISKLDDLSVVWQSGDSYFEWEREGQDEEEPEGEEQPEEEVHSGRKPKSKGGTQRLSTGFGERRARLRGEYQKQREQYEEAASSSKDDPGAEEYRPSEASQAEGTDEPKRKPSGRVFQDEEAASSSRKDQDAEEYEGWDGWDRSDWGSPEEPAGAEGDGSPGDPEESEEVGESQKRRRKKKSKGGEHAHADGDDSWAAWPSLAGCQSAKKWQPKLYPEKSKQRSEQAGEEHEDKSGVLKRMLGLPERQSGDTRKDSDEVRTAKGSDVASEEKRAQKDGKGKSHPGAAKEEVKTKKDSYVDVVVKMFNNEAKKEAEIEERRQKAAREEEELKSKGDGEEGDQQQPQQKDEAAETSTGDDTKEVAEDEGTDAQPAGADEAASSAVPAAGDAAGVSSSSGAEAVQPTEEGGEEDGGDAAGDEAPAADDEIGEVPTVRTPDEEEIGEVPTVRTPDEEDCDDVVQRTPSPASTPLAAAKGTLLDSSGAPFQGATSLQVAQTRKPYDDFEAGERLLAALSEGLHQASGKSSSMPKGTPPGANVIHASDLERHVQSFLQLGHPPQQPGAPAPGQPAQPAPGGTGGWGSDLLYIPGHPSLAHSQAQGLELAKHPRLLETWAQVEWPLDLQPVTSQLEYYFSDANLVQDTYLRSAMMPYNGWVSLVLLHSYPHMQTLPYWAIIQAVCLSSMLELDNTNSYGRIRDKLRRDRWVPRLQLQ